MIEVNRKESKIIIQAQSEEELQWWYETVCELAEFLEHHRRFEEMIQNAACIN